MPSSGVLNKAVILAGSNMGNRAEHLSMSMHFIDQLASAPAIHSSVYQTQAWGNTHQPAYLNQIAVIETFLESMPLLNALLDYEIQNGRKRVKKWEQRSIDLDILFFNSEVIQTSALTIPHPHLHQRRFTLVPLHEVLPDFIHPVLNLSIAALLNQCNDPLKVERYDILVQK
jgi:2-amino-4-hydroxy-6-hydroxymethyldihydropteridine diphosphokinase